MARDRRRYYVITFLGPGDTAEETDALLCELLRPKLTKTNMTLSVYEPSTDTFRQLGLSPKGVEHGVERPRRTK